MPDDRTTYASEQELEELRREVRRLREEQDAEKRNHANGNGKPNTTEGDEKKPPEKQEDEPPKKPHPLRKFILIGVALLVVVAGVLWWAHSRQYESTDDAQVDGHISGIAARITGVISAVYVEENQFVKAGQVLADIDPRDYQTALNQARSQLAQAQAQTQAEQPNVDVTRVTSRTNISTAASEVVSAEAGVGGADRDYDAALAKVRESEANSAKAQADVARYRPLAEKDEVPREQFDQVNATARALAATVSSNQASAAASLRQVDQKRAQLDQARQRLEEARQNSPSELAIKRANVATRQAAATTARAQLEQALLNLSYCKIIAPVDGIVAKRSGEIGQHVTPGQQLLLLSQANGLWVTANFRETQLRQIRPGQSVRIQVDALDAEFNGTIESMPAATGSVTSVLPAENATGNFVKVVQRLPVRIRFQPDQTGLDRLRPGMSVEPKVKVR